MEVSLGSFLAYDIELVLNSFLLSHSSHILSKVYILDFASFNHCTTCLLYTSDAADDTASV